MFAVVIAVVVLIGIALTGVGGRFEAAGRRRWYGNDSFAGYWAAGMADNGTDGGGGCGGGSS